jgi:hypothetical protein
MNLRKRIAIFLAVWVVALPATPVLAQGRTGTSIPEPGAPSRPLFHGEGAEHLVRGVNGVELATTLGHWHRAEGVAHGGRLIATTPWAEQLHVAFYVGEGGVLAEIDERISTFTRLDDAGHPLETTFRVDDREVVVDLREQSARMAGGGAPIEPWELEGYQLLVGALLEEHSLAFWKSVADVHAAAPAGAGCTGEIAQCLLAILGWVGSLSNLTAICGLAVLTGVLTPACLAAVIGHPLVSIGTALACAEALECILEEEDPHSCGD